jgi:pseudoazurin|tara:strand:+ start:285 stop:731 length:447 start_codon:yes stop_codon:yes gene_type:complete
MKFYLPFFLVIMMSTMLLSAAHSEEVVEPTLVIEMLNKRDKEKMLYSDELVRVEVGDTISWVPTSKGHNVQFVSVPEGVEKVKSKLSKEFSYTFETEGVYLYLCTPHAGMGMIGLVLVGDSLENLDSVKKHKLMGKSKKKFKKLLKNI